MEEQFSGILHTMKDGWIDQLFAAFTDEDKFVDWAEDFLEKNPSIDLYYTLLPLNPEPGKMESRRYEIRNPNKKTLLEKVTHGPDGLFRVLRIFRDEGAGVTRTYEDGNLIREVFDE